MPEDASLDAFAPSEADDGTADAEAEPPEGAQNPDAESDEPATESAASAADSVEPASSTYAWSPEGDECADCGASAERRWRRDGQKSGELVCADCKEW